KVTVLIINYNSSYPTLKECIESIKEQTYKNIDILVFDNNSGNNTIDLIESEYCGQSGSSAAKTDNGNSNTGNTGSQKIEIKVKIARSDKNLGLGGAIKQALKTIDSPYVLISSFDVIYDKIAVEEFVEEIIRLD